MNDKLRKLIYDKDTILVFDVDGVLFSYEVGEFNHGLMEDDWKGYLDDHWVYNGEPIKVFKELISARFNKHCRDFVITRSLSESECKQKSVYISGNYDIDVDDIFFVKENDEKLEILKKIYEEHRRVNDEKHIVMIDDSIKILNHIMVNSKFSTIHVSSFLNGYTRRELTETDFYIQNRRLAYSIAKRYGINYDNAKEIVEYVNHDTLKIANNHYN